MNSRVRRKLEMALAIRTFAQGHPSPEPAFTQVLANLDEHIAKAQTLVAREYSGRQTAREARASRRELRRLLQFELLPYLAAIGDVAAEIRRELADQLRKPTGNASNAEYLTNLQRILASALAQKDLLLQKGMSTQFFDDLTRMTKEFEDVAEAVRVARQDHKTARVELNLLRTSLSKDARVLDGIYRYRSGSKDPDLMADWESVRENLGIPKASPAPVDKAGDTPPEGGPAQAA